ncbi:MAG: hypothetical protein QOK05_1169 [Chloroflexota bacterium]|nr:hypothetical protein [Chloroflexota bacterium]
MTATYNWSSVLRHAITSVQHQTMADLEMIIVGDACTDDTAEVVESMNDGRLAWYNRPENSGSQGLPNNDGLARARGRYIAYLGQDDLWHPSHLADLVSRIEGTDSSLVHSLTLYLGPPDDPRREVAGFQPAGGHRREIFVPPSSVLHRRELGKAIGGWRDYRELVHGPDYDFLSRAWDADPRFASTERLTVFKFPSTWRPGSYRLRPSHEQAGYLDRMRNEPDFIEREMTATLRSAFSPMVRTDPHVAPGVLVAQYRQIRGLEPQPLPPPPLGFRLRGRLRGLAHPAKVAILRAAAWIESL